MNRRGHGEGSIFQRKDGLWVGVVDEGRNELGKRSRRVYYGKTRRVVAERVKTAHTAQKNGISLVDDKQTVAAFLTSWLESVRPTLKPRTWVRYGQLVTIHAVPFIGQIPLSRLAPQNLRELYANRLEAGQSASSVRQLHAILGSALGRAARDNGTRDVSALVDAPRVKRGEMHALSPEQAEQFLQAAKTDPLEALYVVALTTGMRQGEILGLNWRDVDLEGGSVSVQRLLQRVNGALEFSEPKTKRSKRRIDLSQRALAALRQHRIRQKEERIRHGLAWEDMDLVFANEVGRPIEASNLIRRSFLPLLEHAGLARIRFHDLRHTAASLLLGRGIHPKIVSEMLGHSTIAITLDTYSHVIPTMQRQAAEAMDAILSS